MADATEAVRGLLSSPREGAPDHRAAPTLPGPPHKTSTRAKVLQDLAVAREDHHRLQVLKSVLQAGPREWWALPLVLASGCTGRVWEDDTIVRFAAHLHVAASSAPTAESRQTMLHALRPHPMLASLVALMESDAPSVHVAARRCSAAEKKQVTRLVFNSAAGGGLAPGEELRPSGQVDLNFAMWFAVMRQIDIEGAVSASKDAAMSGVGRSVRASPREAPRRPAVSRPRTAPGRAAVARKPPSPRTSPRTSPRAAQLAVEGSEAAVAAAEEEANAKAKAARLYRPVPPPAPMRAAAAAAASERATEMAAALSARGDDSLRPMCKVDVPRAGSASARAEGGLSKETAASKARGSSDPYRALAVSSAAATRAAVSARAAMNRIKFASPLSKSVPRRIHLQSSSEAARAHVQPSPPPRTSAEGMLGGAVGRPPHEGVYLGCDDSVRHPLHDVW